jgi:uncharacterized protein (DUF697 family)
MTPSSFLSLYDKLEKLVRRLPEGLQQPILREITPIKTLFLQQRPPRLALIGPGGAGKAELLCALFNVDLLKPGEENLNEGTWVKFSRSGQGALQLLDARRPVSQQLVKAALVEQPPDLFVFVRQAREIDDSLAEDLEHAEQLLAFADSRHETKVRVLGVLLASASGTDVERARQDLNACLHTRDAISARMLGTIALGGEGAAARLAELVAVELPGEAQLEMARLSGNKELQRQIGQVVIKSVTAICAAIGAQPIPLADFPILTALQAMLVGSIMHVSGREMSAKLGAEFIAALGVNVGAGLVLREGARAAAKLVPMWGNAVSGAVAGAGTYAIGRAASAYFIDGVSITDARAIFRRKKSPGLLRREAP